MSNGNIKHVLLVESDESKADYLRDLLKNAGYEVSATWSGLEAYTLLRNNEYDLLIVSHYLPDLYVGEFVKTLQRWGLHLRTLLAQEDDTPELTLAKVNELKKKLSECPLTQ